MLAWLVNFLLGLVLALFGFILKQALDEIKLLRQRMHDALNYIAEIKAILGMRKKERK